MPPANRIPTALRMEQPDRVPVSLFLYLKMGRKHGSYPLQV